jgi:low temperature requirement protein LtrA
MKAFSPPSGNLAGDLPEHVQGRKATWFELFFDLAFVVAVAQLSGSYAHHFDPAGAAGSVLLLLVMWWCWLGHTFHATRFDQQRPDQRGLGLAQIAAVCVIAFGVADAHGARAPAFAIGLAAFKLLLALAYWRERHWRGAHGLIRAYVSLYLLQALLWAASAGLPETPRLALWLLALVLDLASPWWVARETAAVRPHPEHLPERFGLFTIILLGEGVASVVHALDHGSRGARHLRLWAYGHVPLYIGIVSLAAGTVAMADERAWTAGSVALHLCGITLVPLGLGVLRRARVGGEGP